MNSHNNNAWRLIGALILAALLLLLMLLGYGPGGAHAESSSCGNRSNVVAPATTAVAPLMQEPVVAMNQECPAEGETFVMNFPTGSHELTMVEKETLDRLAPCITGRTEVDGHTDSVGTSESNMSLSQKRARAVEDYLVNEKGVPREYFMTEGFGESQPIADNATPAGRAKNRRIEFNLD